CPAGMDARYPGFPVVSFLVDEKRHKLVADLSNLIPRSLYPEARFLSGLTAQVGGKPIGNPRDLPISDWLASAGLVEWDLNAAEQKLLAEQPLQLKFTQLDAPGATSLDEHPEGKYIDVDRRSLRLNPGDKATVMVYARKFGKPLARERIT